MTKKAFVGRMYVLTALICWLIFLAGFGFLLSVVLPIEGYNYVENIRQMIFEPTIWQKIGWILSVPTLLIGTEALYRLITKD